MLGDASLRAAKRRIMVRDSATLLVLVLATIALYAVTSFLFRTFSARRVALGRQYAAAGRELLSTGKPQEAIAALRVSLSYNPDDTANHLLFAEALSRAHHNDEAANYFISLRDAQPADGFINLQLARLARQKHDTSQAIEFYRAASLGNWQSDGIAARRNVQMELAGYLIQNRDFGGARSEILIAAANAPETAALDVTFGDLMLQAGDPGAALGFYRKAAALDPHSFDALFKAGSIAYRVADYSGAASLLALALKQVPASARETPDVRQASELESSARRILSLTLSSDLAPRERVEHLRSAASVARKRVTDCAAQMSGTAALPQELQSLGTQWQASSRMLSRRLPVDDTADQDALQRLIFDSETQTAALCGAPSGDDALLLMLARSAGDRR